MSTSFYLPQIMEFTEPSEARISEYLCSMILYNVTVNINPELHDDWVDWMKTVHIPEVLATGLFVEHKFLRVMSTEPGEGFTYSIQYFLNSIDDYENYRSNFAPQLQADHTARYKDQFVAFRTLLEVV
jgi:hypothetical protein